MFKPYFKIVDAPGQGGRVTSMWYKMPWYCVIASTTQLHSAWAKPIQNPYRELQFGGVTFGLFGKNYWIADDCRLGKFLGLFV